MLPTTIDAVRSILKTDPSVSLTERSAHVKRLREGAEPAKPQPASEEKHILSRQQVASRCNRSLRFVDKLAAEGVLHRIMLPGRKRSCGFASAEVERLVSGKTNSEGAM